MGWIEFEVLGLFCPSFADELVRGKTFEGLESAGEVVGGNEVGQVSAQLVMGFIVKAFDGGVFECPVHAFDLPIGPRMLGFCKPVVDVVLGAGVLEGVGAKEFASLDGQLDFRRGRAGVSRRSEVGAVIGKHRMHLVRDGFEQSPKEVAGYPPGGFFVHLDEGELRGSVDGNEEIQPALLGTDLGDVDMEVPDRIGLELLADGPVALHLRQAADAMAQKTTMQRRPAQTGNRGLERIEAVIERQ